MKEYPIIYVQDTFQPSVCANCPPNSNSRIVNWNFMAHGSVSTDSGSYTPIERFEEWIGGVGSVLPPNGPKVTIAADSLYKMTFTGQQV
jgi:hypothetical protein